MITTDFDLDHSARILYSGQTVVQTINTSQQFGWSETSYWFDHIELVLVLQKVLIKSIPSIN